jgi:hypothetical protein
MAVSGKDWCRGGVSKNKTMSEQEPKIENEVTLEDFKNKFISFVRHYQRSDDSVEHGDKEGALLEELEEMIEKLK